MGCITPRTELVWALHAAVIQWMTLMVGSTAGTSSVYFTCIPVKRPETTTRAVMQFEHLSSLLMEPNRLTGVLYWNTAAGATQTGGVNTK